MKNSELFALDLGTTKFCLATIRHKNSEQNPRIETISVKAEGMRRGMLSDISKATKALTGLIERAEEEFKTNISRVVVGIAGSHLHSVIQQSSISIASKPVTEQLLNELRRVSQKEVNNIYSENLHSVPLAYKLDQREWTNSPQGFSGSSLNGRFFHIKADKHYITDVINLCNLCGLEVCNLYAEPYASASVTLSEKEKDFGVLIADIGGGTTDGVIFHQGKPLKLFTINIGGLLMTHDLSLGLSLPFETAEQLKLSVGLEKEKLNKEIIVKNIHNKPVKVSMQDLYMILFARVLELSQHIKKELDQLDFPLKAGVVLTGGGSEVLGIEKVMAYILKTNVKKMAPSPELQSGKIADLHEIEKHKKLASKYSTVSGMLLLESLANEKNFRHKKHSFFEKYMHHFVSWVKELS